jgi:ATP-dependent Clp protease adaptor protein ClpS
MSTKSLADIVEQRSVKTEKLPEVKLPRKFIVLLLNDDYTPMEFVVEILMKFFHFTEERAIQTMLQVHVLGKAACGIYSRDVAETKVAQVNDFSRTNAHPLLCTMEPE